MADSQVKTANICNITSSTTLSPNVGGSGTYISDNNISVYMSGTVAWSGIYCQYTNVDAVVNDYYTISFTPICATNSTLQIEVAGTAKKITFTSGTRTSVTIQASSTSRYAAFYGGDTVEKTVIIKDIQIEKGETATPYRPYSATGWYHSLRKFTTATDTITTLPADIYADGNNATIGISGNTVQSGTPTPENPIMPEGTGERTGNLFDYNVTWWRNNINDSTNHTDTSTTRIKSDIQDISDSNSYISLKIFAPITNMRIIGIGFFGDDITTKLPDATTITITNTTIIQQIPTGAKHYFILLGDDTGGITSDTKTALASAQICAIYGDVLPNTFIPFGYKIPISSGGVTTNIYLGNTQTVRQIKKLVLTGEENYWTSGGNTWLILDTLPKDFRGTADGAICSHLPLVLRSNFTTNTCAWGGGQIGDFLINIDNKNLTDLKSYIAQQYANGTPVTVWYVLAEPTTATVNEPLMKIGTYADTLSNAASIPTTEGANSITVDTTVQPSEFTATWTGWHDANVKEWDGSQWS